MKRIVVLTGAGISAESGIKTFRDTDGLWENHKIEDVATFAAWKKNPSFVLEFYNQRRKQILEVEHNIAHLALSKLETQYEVSIITQNIDNLHERANSQNVLHLHGEIVKSRSTINPNLIYSIKGWELKLGDKCKMGSQLRPHIVWFGEQVPEMENAIPIVQNADILIVIGTSLAVYPAAGLIQFSRNEIPKYLIDPVSLPSEKVSNLRVIRDTACNAVPLLVTELLK